MIGERKRIGATLLQLLILLISFSQNVLSAIEITQGPQNMTLNEGESASFTCLYNGTEDFPTWYIGGNSFTIQGEERGLPPRHSYSNQVITVRDVQPSDNAMTYRCSFLFGQISSSVATLIVIPAPQDNVTEHIPPTTSPEPVSSSVSTDNVTEHIPPTTSPEPVSSSVSTGVSSQATVSQPSIPTEMLYIGIAIGVAAAFMFIIVMAVPFVICCLVVRTSVHKYDPKSPSPEDSAYDDVIYSVPNLELKVEPNACYSVETAPRQQELEYAEIRKSDNSQYCNVSQLQVIPKESGESQKPLLLRSTSDITKVIQRESSLTE